MPTPFTSHTRRSERLALLYDFQRRAHALGQRPWGSRYSKRASLESTQAETRDLTQIGSLARRQTDIGSDRRRLRSRGRVWSSAPPEMLCSPNRNASVCLVDDLQVRLDEQETVRAHQRFCSRLGRSQTPYAVAAETMCAPNGLRRTNSRILATHE
jgi:hypothetical protein